MKHTFTLLLIFLTSHYVFSQNTQKENEIRELEKEWTMLLEKVDTTALKSIWTENYVVNNAAGRIVTVSDILALLQSGHIFPKVDRYIEKITFNNDLAVVMGREIEHGKDGDEKNRRFTNIWIQTKDGWKLVARQATGS